MASTIAGLSPGSKLVMAGMRPLRVRISALRDVGAAGESSGKRKLRVNERMSKMDELDSTWFGGHLPDRLACFDSDLIFVLSKRQSDCLIVLALSTTKRAKADRPNLSITGYTIPQLCSSSSPTIFPYIL